MRKKWIPALLGVCILLSACNQNENISGKTEISIAKTAEEYGAMPYGEYKERTGNEAEFYHGERFIAEIPDSSLCIIYIGEYDEDVAGAVLSDDDMPTRIQGSLGTLMDGIKEEMSIIELTDALSAKGAAEAAYELLEGAGTAYYVGNKYVQIQFDSDRNGEYDRQLLISMDESAEGNVNPESVAWLETM
ncbi:MAG: hypothetical protein K2K46_10055 [Lachnospiraceae bacterium]|nr:hypothetical protein [Lachnospiraceae bacterium]